MRRLLLMCASAVAIAPLVLSAAPDVVKVDGGQISGTVAEGVRIFKGIPFAAPPVGDLRWKPPQPAAAWTGVRKADAFGPMCMQQPYPESSPYYTSGVTPGLAMGEDCLYLNVWTAAAAAGEKRPV